MNAEPTQYIYTSFEPLLTDVEQFSREFWTVASCKPLLILNRLSIHRFTDPLSESNVGAPPENL